MLKTLLILHITAASLSLLSMFIPMVARKGGNTHRRAGWLYVYSMSAVAITALLLCTRLIASDKPDLRMKGFFLIYISILVVGGLSAGLRVLRAKNRTKAHRSVWDIGVAILLVLSGVAIATYGWRVSQPLLMGMSLIGLSKGGGQLAYWLKPPSHGMHWWIEHMGSMLSSCLATLVAALVFLAPRFGLSPTMLAVWFVPIALCIPGIYLWQRHYKRLFATRQGSTKSGMAPSPAMPAVASITAQ